MFAKIAAFEFRYQLRQPAFWVIGILFFLLAFGSVASDNVNLGSGGNVHKNAPYALAQASIIWALFYMLATTAIVANVVARDATTGFGPIVQTTRVSRFDYLYGRFAGAFAAVALSFLSVSLGMVVGSVMPWVDPETLGPLRVGDYVHAYLVFGLPGVFLTSAIFFALATVTRSMMATYVGVVAFFIVYLTATAALDEPEFERILAWAEPFGASAYDLASRYWTASERNTLNAPLEGLLLINRLLWGGVGLAFLVGAYWLYRPAARGAKLKKQDRLRALTEAEDRAATRRLKPLRRAGDLPRPKHGFWTGVQQLLARMGFEIGLIVRSPAYLVLLVLGVALAVANLLFVGEIYGTPVQLVTRVAIDILTAAFGLIVIIIAIYYAGEIVWRDRDRRTHEIIDASAAPDWSFLIPKTLALAMVLVSTLVVAVLSGIVVQTINGVTDYEIGKYLAWYVWPQTVTYGLLAVLAIFVQSLSPNKFVGWAVMVAYLIATIVLRNLGFENILYLYGRTLAVPLSDMNGTGDFAGFAAWVNAYWTACALVLLVVAYGLWRRGTETRLRPRLKRLPRRLMGPAGAIGAAALAAFVALGGYIHLNTSVWNEYRTADGQEAWLADYERALLQYETTPQPAVADVVLTLDLDPHAPRLETRGQYVLENRTNAPLDQVHLRWDRDLAVEELVIEGARLVRSYDDFDYRIFRFDTPMAPGERRTVRFRTVLQQRGFRNSGNTTRLVDNGTFVNNFEFAPQVGMTRSSLLQDRTVRRKHGLPAELRPAKLEDVSAQARNYIDADWVTSDITITTVAGQTPIAPGYKVSDVTRGDRRTARFVTEAPILHFFSVQSADYQVTRELYRDVELAIYHHPGHDRNVERMLRALRAGLDYFEPAFGEYQFRQARIIEFPDYDSFAQAFANTMPYSEGIGFIADFRKPEEIDYVTYITAHELAHQWWAHQIVGADMQGATALSETLAQYSALMVMERLYGPDQIRRFLNYELDSYLTGRAGEAIEELPLMRVENQQYIHYRKGSLVMYLLKDMMGEDAVNRALRRLIDQYAFQSAPYPRSLDLINALRAEAGPEHQALITDLFERITLYDLKTTGATTRERPDGRFETTITVEARKLYADGQGVETEAPLNEAFDIGLFTDRPGERAFDRADVIELRRRPLRSGRQTITVVTDRAPVWVGADPYNKRIDRNAEDNLVRVER